MLTHCPGSSSAGCYSWAVPSSSSSDVYFQISAPSSYTWIGLGLGSGMAGAEMFLIYKDGSGNVTLSTRTASGEVEPEYEARSGVELIAGSGVKDGKMIANVKCSGDCSRNMDRSGSNSWIGAWRRNGDLQSTSASAEIEEHNDHFSFRVDMSQASVNSGSNPFLGTSEDTTKNNNNGNSNNSNNSGGSNSGVTEEDSSASNTIINAHGIIMAITFAILYPIGAILMPILGSWIVHGVVQFVAFLAMWAGFGLGYYFANSENTVSVSKPSYQQSWPEVVANNPSSSSKTPTHAWGQSSSPSSASNPFSVGFTTPHTSATNAAHSSATCTSGTAES